jgi:hypothetical protein
MSLTVLTTCNLEGFHLYGKRMLESYTTFWPCDTRFICYVEGFEKTGISNVEHRKLPLWFERWKQRHESNPAACGRIGRYDYRRDCVRFSHKVAALTDAIEHCSTELLIWADADTLTHAPVDSDWIYGLLADGDLAWLERAKMYPECGFMILRVAAVRSFLYLLRRTYESDAVFQLRETHDSYVIQQIVQALVSKGALKKPVSLSGKHAHENHPFAFGPLGDRLDHAKGRRKATGRTPKEEVKRGGSYWE